MSALLVTLCSLTLATGMPMGLSGSPKSPTEVAHTDSHIIGHVVDASTKKHIAGATVIIQEYNISVTTDASGHYSFRNQKPGKLTLTMLADGYLAQSRSITLQKGETQEVNFEAVIDNTQLEEVVVTANRQRTLRRYAPTLVSVIDNKSFQLNNAVNLAGGLTFKPGIRVENDCQNCGFNQVRINGLDGRYSQILIDSRPVFSALAGVYGLEQLPANMIDRVEVVRGGGSALYGSSAIAGVINVITKEPTTNSFSLSENISLIDGKKPDNTIAFNGTILSPDRKMGAMLFGQHRTRTGWDANGDGFSELGQLESRALGTQVFFRLNPYNKITAEIHSIQEKRRGGDHFERPEHVVAVAESVGHSIISGNIRYDVNSSNYKHNLQLYTSGQHILRNSYYGGIDESNVADDKHPTPKEAYGDNYGRTQGNVAMGGAQYTYKTDRLLFMPGNILVGAEYLYDHLFDQMPILRYQKLPDGTPRATDLDQHIHNFSQIAQVEWTNKTFTLLLGGRLDEHTMVKTAKGDALMPIFTPRATVRYNPFSWMNLRASYAQGFRAPQTFDEDLHVGVVSGEAQKVSNALGLKPEYSHSFNISNDMYFAHGGLQANLLLEGFFTRLQGAFNTRPLEERDGFSHFERYNASDASVYGANLEGKVSYKKFTAQAGFTFAKSLWDKAESTGVERSLIKGEKASDPRNINTLVDNGPATIDDFLKDAEGKFVNTELYSRNFMRTPMTYGYITLTYNPVSTLNLTATCNYTGSMYAPHVIEYGAESAVIDRDLVATGKRKAGVDASGSAPKWGRIEKTPSFFDLGARISYDFDIFTSSSLQLFVGANNILNSFQKDFDLGGGRDSGYIYGPTQPRTVYAGMTMKF